MYGRQKPDEFREGQLLSAAQLNQIRRMLIQQFTIKGGQILRQSGGVAIIPAATSGPSAGGTTLKFAKITGRAGTEPPWRYSAVQVQHDGSAAFETENYTTVTGGDTMSFALINLEEKTDGGMAPIEDDAIVAYWAMGDYFACSVSTYRGTY